PHAAMAQELRAAVGGNLSRLAGDVDVGAGQRDKLLARLLCRTRYAVERRWDSDQSAGISWVAARRGGDIWGPSAVARDGKGREQNNNHSHWAPPVRPRTYTRGGDA